MEDIAAGHERPAECTIDVESDNEAATVIIPPHGYNGMLGIVTSLAALYVLGILVLGVSYFCFRHGSLFISDFRTAQLHFSSPAARAVLAAGWLLLFGIGIYGICLLLPFLFQREVLRFDREGVTWSYRTIGKGRTVRLARLMVRGFHLDKDPQHRSPGRLFLYSEGAYSYIIGEYARPVDKEWLAGVCTTMHRRYMK